MELTASECYALAALLQDAVRKCETMDHEIYTIPVTLAEVRELLAKLSS